MSAEKVPTEKSLVGIVQEYNGLIGLIMEANGELTPELESALAINQEQLATKADGYDFIISKLETEEEYWKARADQYLRVAKVCANARQRMRDAIKGAMQVMGTTEVVGENATFKLVKSAPKLVLNEREVPKEYFVETVVRELNKPKVKGALQDGIEVPGAKLEPVVALRIGVTRQVKS